MSDRIPLSDESPELDEDFEDTAEDSSYDELDFEDGQFTQQYESDMFDELKDEYETDDLLISEVLQ